MTKKCVQCGKSFDISEQELEYYESQHIQIPVCCRSCRRHNRIQKRDSIPRRYFGLFPARGRTRGKDGRRIRTGGPAGMVFRGKYMLIAVLALLIYNQVVSNRVTNYQGSKTASSPAAVETAAGGYGQSGNKEPLTFRNFDLLTEHFEKHGREMGYDSVEAYFAAANEVVDNPDSLHKKEAEDGDDIYFLPETGDLVIVSTDGYIRTYFRPEDGIAYYNRQ